LSDIINAKTIYIHSNTVLIIVDILLGWNNVLFSQNGQRHGHFHCEGSMMLCHMHG